MSAMPSSRHPAAKRPPSAEGGLDRLFDRLVADLRATGARLAAARPAS